MNYSKIWSVVGACLVLAGCQSASNNKSEFFLPRDEQDASAPKPKSNGEKPPSPQQADLGLAQAVIRRFADDFATSQKSKPSVIYISLTTNRLDPAPEYLNRVRVSGVQLKPLSAARASRSASSANDAFLGIENAQWFDLYNVTATCSWSPGEGPRRYFAYQARWEKKKWIIR